MWPWWRWQWDWMWHMLPPAKKEECDKAHTSLDKATEVLVSTHQRFSEKAKEARHSARNIRMMLHELADRVGRVNAKHP
jgi:hypothetical protein